MALSRRHKLTIISLSIYWPTFFIVAHIPIPSLVRKAGVSDKALHLLAYLVLAFLLWVALNPNLKVRWRRAPVWWVLLALTVYGVVDELLQGYVGRSCDIRDLGADLAGIVAGLLLLSLFTFWPAALIVAGATIVGLTNIARTNLADLLPITNAMFRLLAYAVFTGLWIRNIQPLSSLRAPKPKWLIVVVALPTVLLLVVKSFSVMWGRDFEIQDVILSVMGILAAVGAACVATRFRKKLCKTQEPSSGDG